MSVTMVCRFSEKSCRGLLRRGRVNIIRAALMCLALSLVPLGFAYTKVMDEPLDPLPPGLRLVNEFGITSRDAPLFAAPEAGGFSDSYVDAWTIVRLDAAGNGFVRIKGSEWFLLANDVDNVNVIVEQTPMYAVPLTTNPLRAGVGSYAPELEQSIIQNQRVMIEGETGDSWLVQVDGVYGFIIKNQALIMPRRLR
ncbi:hypothetical protein AGMMS49992_30870 [Clostridia bacterium]|nr:hypothetical protein AGMMS49992_30870 [Clostridia bacterium]